jgi:hypothetical protein
MEEVMTRKLFAPKPFEVGDTITWTHFHHGGRSVTVKGVVVCGAPNVAGNRTMWVQPTTEGFSEIYSHVPVVRVGRDRFSFTVPLGPSGGSGRKGELVSSGVMGTETYWMMRAAWEHGQRVKAERATTELPVAA